MRLIDADALECDTEWSEYYDGFVSYSQMAIDTAPSIEPNLLIVPDTIERGSEVFIGEDIVVCHHDDYMDIMCKAMMWDEYRDKLTAGVTDVVTAYHEGVRQGIAEALETTKPKRGEWIALEVLKEILIDVKQEHSNSLEATSVVNDIWHEVRASDEAD